MIIFKSLIAWFKYKYENSSRCRLFDATNGISKFLLPKWNAKHGHEVFIITSDRYTPFNNYDET